MAGFVQSASSGAMLIAAATAYRILGPLPVGGVLRRLRVCWSVGNAALASCGFVLVSTEDEAEVAFQSGRSLIGRGSTNIAGVPAVSFLTGTDMAGTFDLFWGVRLLPAERYILGALKQTVAVALCSMVFSAEMLPRE